MSDFNIDGGVLLKYSGNENSVTVPEEVTSIEEMAFYGNNTIEKLGFEEGVRDIKRNAFSPCKALQELTFPESLESIGEFAFSCCRRLKSIEFSNGILKIGKSAFSMCRSLKEVKIPENLKVLERGTFLGCTGLKKVVISKNLEKVDVDAFSGCTALMNFEVNPENGSIKDREGVLYSKDGKTLLLFPGGRLDIKIPDDVTEIGYHAFYENHNVDRLTLPGGLEKISEGAFYRCTELNFLALPGGLKKIDRQAFQGCSGLENMFIPDSVVEIGESTFRDCRKLSWIKLPEEIPFDIHWFCTPNDSGAFSADHTVIPFITTRKMDSIDSELGKFRAADGYICACIDGIEIEPEVSSGYLEFIKLHVKDYYDKILKDVQKLKWFCDNKLIPEEDVEPLLDRTDGNGAAGAILLEFQGKKAGTESEEKNEHKSAKDKLDERFSALENALDF